jgi:hypothetical protein
VELFFVTAKLAIPGITYPDAGLPVGSCMPAPVNEIGSIAPGAGLVGFAGVLRFLHYSQDCGRGISH